MRLPLLVSLFIYIICALAHADPRILRVRTFGDPLTFDWNRAFTPVEATLVRNLMEGLVAIGQSSKPEAALAERYTVSSDGLTYTFHLRKDVKWSDGVQLKAYDFIHSWRRLLSPQFKGNYAYLLLDIVNAEAYNKGELTDFNQVGVKAVDDFTLQVKLRAPVAYWIWIPTFWATFPVRQDLLDKFGSQWDKPGNLVTLGPFLLKSYEEHRNVVLERNPKYYGKRGNVDQVIAALVKEDGTAVSLYEQNQLDFVTKVSAADAARLKGRLDFKRWKEARTVHLDFNPNQAPTNDVRVRKAIAMALDRKKISKVVEGAYQPATSFVPPGFMSYSKNAGLKFDLAAARKLLNDAGFSSGRKDEPAGLKTLTLDLITVGFTDETIVAKFIAEELKAAFGAEVNVVVLAPKQFYSPTVSLGGFSLLLNRWTADYLDADNFYSIFLSNAGNNRVGWKNAAYDEHVKKARSLTSSKEREKAYNAAQNILLKDDVIAVPLYYGQNGALVRLKVTGFKPTPTNSYLFKDFSLK